MENKSDPVPIFYCQVVVTQDIRSDRIDIVSVCSVTSLFFFGAGLLTLVSW